MDLVGGKGIEGEGAGQLRNVFIVEAIVGN
jgi:hypothetical protein